MDDQNTKPELSEEDKQDYKMFLAFATNGILCQIPFGISIDPVAVAQAASNTAMAMLQVQKDTIK